MKKLIFLFILISMCLGTLDYSLSQSCSNCECGTEGEEYNEPDSLIGGRYKPSVSNFPNLILTIFLF